MSREYSSPFGLETNTKPSNPKDTVGVLKAPMSTVSMPVLAEIGVAMREGACKYGRHNYRVIGVRASVYYDATWRHLATWWEGEDIDPHSGVSHITKAIASLVVLRDAMIQNKYVDDRPPPSPANWMEELNDRVQQLAERYPNPVPPFTAASVAARYDTSRVDETKYAEPIDLPDCGCGDWVYECDSRYGCAMNAAADDYAGR